jgi:hypothetical protein
MTIVSCNDFAANQDKYFEIALYDDVCIKKGENLFYLVKETSPKAQKDLEIEEELRNAISLDELRDSAYEHIHSLFANK